MQEKPKIEISYDDGVQKALGERKYSTYMEALNESIQNCCDNKARIIKIFISEDRITVEDDGIGMDEKTFNQEYFRIGKQNVDPAKGGLFGIGCLGDRALTHKTEIISHVEGSSRSIKVKIDWDKPREEQVENTDWVDSDEDKHGTIKILTHLKYKPGDPRELRKYLERKHFPKLVNPKSRLRIIVNEQECRVVEPEYEAKYEFDSWESFHLGEKFVPKIPDAEFGRVTGTIYITKPDKTNRTHVYDRLGGRLDRYSEMDWLKINSLTSSAAFKSRVLTIIITTTEKQIGEKYNKGKWLLIKSDRSGFFEEVDSFRQLVEYLNGIPNKGQLNLPHGGVIRLIHAKWLEEYQARKEEKFEKASDEAIKNVIPTLNELFKDDETVWKTNDEGEEKEKVKKKEKKKKDKEKPIPPKRKRLQCPNCNAFNYITITEYKVYVKNPNTIAKEKMRKNWPCKVCGYYLNPETDLHKIKSSEKKKGTSTTRVKIGEGKWVDIQHQGLGENGDLGVCDISEEFIYINDEHALYRRAYETGKETGLEQHMITTALYALARAKERELGIDFEFEFNKLCANVHHLIDKRTKHSKKKS